MTSEPAFRFARAAPTVLVALVVAFATHPIEDFDVWYHLAAGRLIVSEGLPSGNTFAFSAPDHPWVDLHWLFQILLYGVWSLAGANGGIALLVALVLTSTAILYLLARRFVSPTVATVLLAVSLTIASPRFVVRPELLSFVLFALFLWLLEHHPQNGRAVLLLVPLQILWANVQGIFAIGLVLIGCYWLGATLALLRGLPRGWRQTTTADAAGWRRLSLVLVLATLGCIVNPWGLTGALFPLELLPRVTGQSLFSLRIGEFRGPFESGYAPPLAWSWAILMAVTGMALLLDVRRWHLGRLLAALAFAALSTQSLRNMAFFAWIAVPTLAAALAPRAHRALRAATPPRRVRVLEAAALAAVAGLAVAVATNHFSRYLQTEREFGLGISRARVPTEALAFVEEVGIRGNPFNCLAVGGYLIWTRYPEDRAFVDGRLEAFPEEVFRHYFRVMDDPAIFPQVAARYGFDWVLLYHVWGNRLPLVRYLAAGHGWRLVYYDEIASIFLPDDEAHRAVRERADRAFGALRTRRASAAAPPPPTTLERLLAVPVAETWRQRAYGGFLRSLGLWTEAVVAYKRALALDPTRSDTRFELGVSYWYAGEREAAVLEWRDLVRRDPSYAPARDALARVGATAS